MVTSTSRVKRTSQRITAVGTWGRGRGREEEGEGGTRKRGPGKGRRRMEEKDGAGGSKWGKGGILKGERSKEDKRKELGNEELEEVQNQENYNGTTALQSFSTRVLQTYESQFISVMPLYLRQHGFGLFHHNFQRGVPRCHLSVTRRPSASSGACCWSGVVEALAAASSSGGGVVARRPERRIAAEKVAWPTLYVLVAVQMTVEKIERLVGRLIDFIEEREKNYREDRIIRCAGQIYSPAKKNSWLVTYCNRIDFWKCQETISGLHRAIFKIKL